MKLFIKEIKYGPSTREETKSAIKRLLHRYKINVIPDDNQRTYRGT